MGQIIYSLVPLIVMVLAHFVLGEKVTKSKIIGLIIALAGLGFLLMQSIVKTEHLTFGTPLGNGLILIATICWSIYLVYSKKIADTFSSSRITFVNFIFTAVILLLFVPVEYQVKPLHMNLVTIIGAMVLISLAVGTVIQYMSMQYGIKKTTATTASVFQYMGPFFATLFAVPILHEKPTVSLIVGGILILLGVFYATTFSLIKRRFAPVLQ
ncbi:MAG TPA: DMT family transporter [Candidatus Saccharimonadales bacterium]|nr:DMT family transporter [Candidatus Saccharimonadales bacterium]